MRQQKYKNPAESHKRSSVSFLHFGKVINFYPLLLCLTLLLYSVDFGAILKSNIPLSEYYSFVPEECAAEFSGVSNILLPHPYCFSTEVYLYNENELFNAEAYELFALLNYSYYAKSSFTSLVVNRLDGGCLDALVHPGFQIYAINFLSSTTVDWHANFQNSIPKQENVLLVGKKYSYNINTFKYLSISDLNVLTMKDGNKKSTIPLQSISAVSGMAFGSFETIFNQSNS